MKIINPNVQNELKPTDSDVFDFLVAQIIEATKQSGVSCNDTSKIGNNLFDIQVGDTHLITNEDGLKEFNKQVINKFEGDENN